MIESLERGLEIGFMVFFMLLGLFSIQILNQGMQLQQKQVYRICHTERFIMEVKSGV